MTRNWKSMLFVLLVAWIAFSLPSPARAAIVTSVNESVFLANLGGGNYLEQFLGLSSSLTTLGPSLQFVGPAPADTFAYDVTTADQTFTTAGSGLFGGLSLLSTSVNTDIMVFTFQGFLPTAIGGNFFVTDAGGAQVSGPETVSVLDAGGSVLLSETGSGFIGFLSNGPSFGYMLVQSESVGNYPTLSSLNVGDAIPEPATLALLGGGLLALGMFRKRSTR